ncbi:Uncharacterized protein BM_BM8279 [Brugia malayi]|uniref:PDZ domain-containing protein n=1 Tax=Brugia malayi TaxID=6279 RepID=A0A4E9FS69_BRUMA|nr:Uncharacterized protein BM_BM8279 [Brugia malayi]VIP00058.1 Uncharacterized protein BM_BM8279 [Brugia malayi]
MGEGQNKWPRPWNHPGLSEETIVLNKPFGIRIQKTTWKIVFVDPCGAAANLAFVGDIILSVDDIEIHDSITLIEIMHKSTAVCVHARDLIPPDESDLLGLSVSYDARERLQVASAKCWSLAAIHLRPGDTIKEVNRHPVASKSMLQYWILASMEKNGFVELLIHSNVDQNSVYDYELEMPEDVVTIAAREIKMLRSISSKQFQETKTILRKGLALPKHKISVSVCDKIIEFPIGSDYDPKKLRKERKGNSIT